MIEKYESRRIRVDICHVLMDVWDPIGVKNAPTAQDEYDMYIGGICELLVSGASDDAIANRLWKIVTDRMGLTTEKQDMMPTVQALRAIRLP
jgi:hypothetical protein